MHSYFTVIGLGVQWLRVDSRLSCDQYFGEDVLEVLVCYALRVYESQRNP
jgi:hypothetical protein